MRWLIPAVFLLWASAGVCADSWTIDHERSRLGFTFTQEGDPVRGGFREFSAVMRFAPGDLPGSAFDVTVDVSSVETGNAQRDGTLTNKPWFHSDAYPEARFTTSRIRRAGDRYEAVGELRIRDQRHRIVLPFDWRIEGDTATMTGGVTIDRTRWGVGQGEWSTGDTVARSVTVDVDLRLRRRVE